MWCRSRAFPLALMLFAALASGSAGCAKNSPTVTGPRGDNGGEFLLTFRSDRLGTPGQYDILLYDIGGSGYRSVSGLNSPSDESEPCLSNDGNFVAFASNRAGAGGYDVLVYDRLTQALIATPNLNTAANETGPRFTYDSVELAFAGDSAGVKRIRLYDPVSRSLIPLPGLAAAGPFDDEAPAPDLHGNRIAFESNRSGRRHVYVWDRASGLLNLPALVSDSEDVEPALTADGRWLAFASNRAGGHGGFDVYLLDLTGSALIDLGTANTALDERHPTLSADGMILYFQSRTLPADKWDLFQYSRFASARTQPAGLPSAGGDDTQPYLRWR